MTKKEFKEALLKVQGELKAPKNQYNNFGKYKYRNAEDILEAAKPLLVKEGLLMTVSDEVVLVGDRYYVKATVEIEDGEGNSKSVSAQAREEEDKKGMDGSQVTGASSSYARKYALNGMFLIDDTKDSDSTNDKEPTEKKKAPAKTAPVKTEAAKKEAEPKEEKKEEKETKGKQVIQIDTPAFDGAVKWVAASKDLIFDAIEKLKKKYDIPDDVEKEIEKRVVSLRTGAKEG